MIFSVLFSILCLLYQYTVSPWVIQNFSKLGIGWPIIRVLCKQLCRLIKQELSASHHTPVFHCFVNRKNFHQNVNLTSVTGISSQEWISDTFWQKLLPIIIRFSKLMVKFHILNIKIKCCSFRFWNVVNFPLFFIN